MQLGNRFIKVSLDLLCTLAIKSGLSRENGDIGEVKLIENSENSDKPISNFHLDLDI